jgi:hypothetical protein
MVAALAAWLPTAQDVANLVPNRTGAIDVNDVLVPRANFDVDTVPTATQVLGLARGVQSEVAAVIGAMPDQLAVFPTGGTTGESSAGHVVALGAAALIETGFYPDQQLGGDSPSAVMERRFRAALAALARAALDINSGTDPGDQPRPSAAFPDTIAWGRATTSWESW